MQSGVPAHHFLYLVVAEEAAVGQGAQDVVVDEFEDLLLLSILLETGVLYVRVHQHEVLLALASESWQLVLLVGRHVLEQQFPGLGAVL